MPEFKKLSIHRPKSQPLSLKQFCFFLAGLIDADGEIDPYGNIIIAFHSRDISVAYFIKARVGYGRVTSVKGKKTVTFVCNHPEGKKRISQWICNRLINTSRIEQFNSRLVPTIIPQASQPGTLSFQNHWLAGFIQKNGSFQIQLAYKRNQFQQAVRAVLQIDSKDLHILSQLQMKVGGFVGYRASQNIYYYSSVSFARGAKLIHYLDRFQVMGPCVTQYWMWRKCYIIVQEKGHLNPKGLARIAKIKAQISKLNSN